MKENNNNVCKICGKENAKYEKELDHYFCCFEHAKEYATKLYEFLDNCGC